MARAARVRAVRAATELAQCIQQIRKRIALDRECATLELASAVDHLREHQLEVGGVHLADARGRTQHR